MIAIIRVRGMVSKQWKVEETLRMLNLYRKNYCTLVEDVPQIHGMLNRVKDFVTWGEVDEQTTQLLKKRSGKRYYRLNSPRKGFGKHGIKRHFVLGGALGDRKDKINDLIQRMSQ